MVTWAGHDPARRGARRVLLNFFGGRLLIPTLGRVGGEAMIVIVLLVGLGLIGLGVTQVVRGSRR